MLLPIVDHMAALAERLQLAKVIVRWDLTRRMSTEARNRRDGGLAEEARPKAVTRQPTPS
jgi:hypothetical protein